MISAFSGFALIAAIVLAGWVVGRWGALPAGAEAVLGRVVYLALAPCLLFSVVATADLGLLFSEPVIVSTAAAFLTFLLYAVIVRRVRLGDRVMGAMAAGYTNANYVGIPVATYVLHDAALVVPILILQLLVITPIALSLMEIAAEGRATVARAVGAPLRNPLNVAVALGALVSVLGVRVPAILADPITAIGRATVPLALITFGLSLHGRRVLAPGSGRLATITAVVLKTAGMPLIAFLLAVALGLDHRQTYAVTVLAALPTAQNVFLYAQRFDTALPVVRDAIFLSTVLCVPVLLLITVLFSR